MIMVRGAGWPLGGMAADPGLADGRLADLFWA